MCEWPKDCSFGEFAHTSELGSLCGMHFLEWIDNMQWRPDLDGKEPQHFSITHKHGEYHVCASVTVGYCGHESLIESMGDEMGEG